MKTLRTLNGLDSVKDRAVLVRVDFNVPLADGRVADDTRIRAALPTILELRKRGGRLVLMSHLGRPKGAPEPALSLAPVARHLAGVLDADVPLLETTGGETRMAIERLRPGGLIVLENLRFHPGEKANDAAFADELAALGSIYVNDAFGTAHRTHASVVAVAERVADRAAGRLLEREIQVLGRLLDDPDRPFVVVVGGAKIEGKIDTLVNLLPRLDALAVGGGMANTFLAAQGLDLARSLVEDDRLELAAELLETASANDTDILLPIDLVVADDLDAPRKVETVRAEEVPPNTLALDIGPASRSAIADLVAQAHSVFWNGPLGVFEKPPFDQGTVAVAEAIAASKAWTVIGGGETVAATRKAGVTEAIGHVSTGGGASLELLAGKSLPGVTVLEKTP